jgi:hypothetical protein
MKVKSMSNYELFKRIDKALEKEELGQANTAKEVKPKLQKCEFCNRYTAQSHAVRSDLLGYYHDGSAFNFKYLTTCTDCKETLSRMDINEKPTDNSSN